jgi:hypothetical protein
MIVLLDAGPLGMITNPKSSPENEACKNWLAHLASRGFDIVIPEIADYEVRRELLRAGKDRGLARLDALKGHARLCAYHNGRDAQGRRILGDRPKNGAAVGR